MTAHRHQHQEAQLRTAMTATAVLLLMFALALGSMVQKAPTFDEQGFIVRGLAALRGYPQIRVGHPLGLNALNAALLANDPTVALPLDDPSWGGTSFHRPAELFLWEIGNDFAHVMFLARLPSLWLGLLLAALAGRWAGQLSGRRWVGLLALGFVALDPNVLAHTRLATTDLGLTVFALFAAYTLWRFLKRPSWAAAILAGAALGLLQNTKFTAALFVPLFVLVILIWLIDARRRNGRVPWSTLLILAAVYPATALLTLWAANGFDIGTLPPELPTMSALSGMTMPLAGYVEQVLDIGGRMRVGTPSFLLGQYSDSGWWMYFPVAFLLKTPLATLLLLTWGGAAYGLCLLRRGARCPALVDSAALLIPTLGFFAIALTTDINLGYRHILPTLPFLIVFAVTAVGRRLLAPLEVTAKVDEMAGEGAEKAAAQIRAARRRDLRGIAPALALAAWLGLATLFIYPDFLAFFNLLAGGPDNGWRSLVDSNLDWGQDLDDLAPWMTGHGVDEVWLSYFGEARPEAYGIAYQGLDSFPPRLMDPAARPFYPADPAPGIYAISATNLQGVHFADHDQFAFFRGRAPLDKLGYSIFLYDVPPHGRPVDLLLAGVQVDEIAPEAYARLGSNDARLRWFDPTQTLLLPGVESFWWAGSDKTPVHPLLGAYLDLRLSDSSEQNGVYLTIATAPAMPEETLANFTLENGRVLLRDIDVLAQDDGGTIVRTMWRQDGLPQPLQLFIHALDNEQNIIAQWDGLGASWQGWRTGDTLVQLSSLPVGSDELAGLKLVIGLVDPRTGRRWQTSNNADFYEVGS